MTALIYKSLLLMKINTLRFMMNTGFPKIPCNSAAFVFTWHDKCAFFRLDKAFPPVIRQGRFKGMNAKLLDLFARLLFDCVPSKVPGRKKRQ